MELGQADRKVHFSRELQLALDCCAFSFRKGSAARPTGVGNVDWPRFIQLARFHRMEGIAWNALAGNASLPAQVRSTLSQAATSIAANTLRASLACHQVLERFEAARVPLLFLKGLTLGATAYGNPTIKAAIDVDLLIDPADLSKASRLLRDCGYCLVAPRESPEDQILHAWHRSSKESVWSSAGVGLQIDLHTRTADNPRLIPSIDVHTPRQLIEVGGGVRLPTLAEDELIAYLAVHGASSAWFRLKWISDFAALLEGRPAAEIGRLYARSQELGAGRAAGQALLLADSLFGTLNRNAALAQSLMGNRATRRLYRAAYDLLTGEPAEPTERLFGTMPMHWTQLLLLPGASFASSELLRQANRLLVRARC
jgi:hypothetical protein